MGQGGSGLGLAILSNLTQDVLGGNVALHSVFGQGSRFSLSFPIDAPLKEPVQVRP